MHLDRVLGIARTELRLFRREPVSLVIQLGMPLLLTAFLKPTYRGALAVEGYRGVNGSEHAVPGLAVMFTFFLIVTVGVTFLREHAWNTWDRMRASGATTLDIVAGKAAVPFAMALVQLTILFAVGDVVFGLPDRSNLALAIVALALALCLVSIGLALTSLCRSLLQLSAVGNLGSLLMGGLGGALTPQEALPGWARVLSPATPTYWAMQGFRRAILDGGTPADVVRPAGVLLCFAAGFLMVAARRFRVDERKVTWV